MERLPTGTVTLLFGDIESSTALLHELGAERYAAVLADFHRLVREVIDGHHGAEVDTEGDGFFVAFARARDAVEAAAEAQERLADHPLRVRMGLHTGEPLVVDGHYAGIDVHRAARIADAGHGGQVLVSQSTRELLEPSLEVRDLGRHRLKDLGEPVRVYQLGTEKFPPIRSLDTTNLPVQPTPLIGREQELEA